MANQQDIDTAVAAFKVSAERLAALGLLPQDGARISARGEFIVGESNIEEAENKKRKRFHEYSKTLHAWGLDPATGVEGPLELVVHNRAEQDGAEALGWSENSVHGPGGRLLGGETVAPVVEEVTAVRQFAAPGQVQPFEAEQQAPKAAPVKAVKAKASKAPTKKK